MSHGARFGSLVDARLPILVVTSEYVRAVVTDDAPIGVSTGALGFRGATAGAMDTSRAGDTR